MDWVADVARRAVEQSRNALEPASEYAALPHDRQEEELVAPTRGWKVNGGHVPHSCEALPPVCSEEEMMYCPGPQLKAHEAFKSR